MFFRQEQKKGSSFLSWWLIDHILSTTNIVISIMLQLEKIYGCHIDFDAVISSSLLHDIMKPVTYKLEELDKNSSLGHYLDHLTLSVIKLFQEGFSLKSYLCCCSTS